MLQWLQKYLPRTPALSESVLRSPAACHQRRLLRGAAAFGGEWLQRYLPGRTAEITSVLLALAMGWLVAALGRRRRPDRSQSR